MRKKRIHILACWLAVFTYMLNVAAASAGLVRCEDNQGKIAIEAGCDHDHCVPNTPPPPSVHDHDHADDEHCICGTCSCEDTPVEVNALIAAKRLADSLGVMALPIASLPACETIASFLPDELGPGLFERPSPFAQTLCALRTTVLLI